MRKLTAAYEKQYDDKAEKNPDLVFFLGDSPDFAKTWSASSGKIPTFRRNCASGKYWFPAQRRWLTSSERLPGLVASSEVGKGIADDFLVRDYAVDRSFKHYFCFWCCASVPSPTHQLPRLCAMSFPANPAVAAALGVPVMGTRDPKRAGQILGNAMSVQNACLVQMVALACFCMPNPQA